MMQIDKPAALHDVGRLGLGDGLRAATLSRRASVLALLIFSSLTSAGLGADSPKIEDVEALHYFKADLDVPAYFLSFAYTICDSPNLVSGFIDRNFNLKCTGGTCVANYWSDLSYVSKKVYLTPLFTTFFEENSTDSKPEEQSYSLPLDSLREELPPFTFPKDSTMSVTISKFHSAHALELVKNSTKCLEEVGSKLADLVKPYDAGSVIASLPVKDTADYKKDAYDLNNLEHAALYVSYPKRMTKGEGRPVEATLILSQPMVFSEPTFTKETELQYLRGKLLKISSANLKPAGTVDIETAKANVAGTAHIETAKVTADIKAPTGTLSIENYQLTPLPFVIEKAPLESVTLTLAGGDTLIAPLSSDSHATPLHADFWSWVVTGKKSGDLRLYLAVSASDRDQKATTRVIQLDMRIDPDWWETLLDFIDTHLEWIVASGVIPLILFAWHRWFRRKSEPSGM